MIWNKLLIRFKPNFQLGFFLTGGLIGLLIIFIFLSLGVFWISRHYQNQVYPGVFLFGQPITGKTISQLDDWLEQQTVRLNDQKISFYTNQPTEKKWEITPQTVDFNFDHQAVINQAITYGRNSYWLKNYLTVFHLLIAADELKPAYQYSLPKLESLAKQLAFEIDRPVQDALFEFKNNRVVNFQVAKDGYQLDQEQLRSIIILAFSRPNPAENFIAVDLPIKIIKPQVTTDQTNNLGIKELIASGESYFIDSIPTRVHNIILAASSFHGVIIRSGETFSFAKKIGSISAELGYQQAYVIKENKTILEDGGGVCQVSTTLFRAALNAGLPIIERQAHYYRVGYYEQGGYPPGLDATVYPPSPDLKFKNDTPGSLLIQTKIDQNQKKLTFEIYGAADGRKVTLEKPIIHSQTPAPEPIYVDEPNLAVGVVKRLDTAHNGAKVSVTRRIFNADGSLKEEKTWWSNYVPWPAVYQRGTKT